MTIPDDKRRKCNDNALDCFGTAYIFGKRAASIRIRITLLTFLGIAAPAAVGAIICTFQLMPQNMKYVLVIAGAIGIIQLIFSIWALVAGWNDNLSYYLESKSHNFRLADQYSDLAKTTSVSLNEFILRYEVLEAESRHRNDLDNRHDLSDKEHRLGMRAGLRQYQRPCSACGDVPTTLKTKKECGVCGK